MTQTSDLPGRIFLFSAASMAAVALLMFVFIFATAAPVMVREGIGFITGTVWSYDTHQYGILYFIAGTLALTAVTMLLAVPLGIGTAIFLTEWAPAHLDRTISTSIELLVGIPSVIYGIFGYFVLEPIFRLHIDPAVSATLGWIPIFYDSDPGSGSSILLASFVLAIMVLPTITALSREAMRSVPREYREGSLALGATRWETVRHVVFPASMAGILTAVILGMMRAMGETMAVVMLLGNVPVMPHSILDPAYAMTSKILNDIGYRVAEEESKSALFGIATVLFLIEMALVALVRGVSARYDTRGGNAR
ncbi:MAG: phosphate transport system permease protein [Methanofollis sp.]|nr:phosphate transport system permease protein [Methanofollis sp.]